MRILLLGTSNDRQPLPGTAVSRIELIEQIVSRDLGRPVTITLREAWPNEALPPVFERWLERYEPDLVYIQVNGYWYLYSSVPVRLRRRFGPLGRRLAAVGERAGEARWASWNPPVRGLRALLTAAVGGEPHFTPDEVVTRVEECVRLALRHEGIAVGIRPSWGDVTYARSAREAARKEQLRLAVQARLATMAQRLHVYCEVTERPHWQSAAEHVQADSDGIHQGVRGLEFTARRLAESIKAAIAAHAEDAAGPAPIRPLP